jgi:hypothetical protein
LNLVQVSLLGTVSAAASDRWTIISHDTLPEFLARADYEVPDGTPLIRLDLTGDTVYFDRLCSGPHWDVDLRRGQVRPPLGEPRRYEGETWTQMRGWWLAPNVYAKIAPTAGVVVEQLPGSSGARG